ncbi:hypothetical protein OY671_009191, partial [Metschnikowia pulcherrima]
STRTLSDKAASTGFFDAIVGSGDTEHPKPDAAPLHLASTQLGGTPRTASFVGDSGIDAACAPAAGVRSAAHPGGYAAAPDALRPQRRRRTAMSDIQISGMTKRFGNAAVLQELDSTVRDGEFLTSSGASGCGKSTLSKSIAGSDTPDTGTIRMGDRDSLASSPSARDCAMVFQSYALYPHMTVFDNMAFGS